MALPETRIRPTNRHVRSLSVVKSRRFLCTLLVAGLLAMLGCSGICQLLTLPFCHQSIVHPFRMVGRRWHPNKPWHRPNTFPACSIDACLDFSRCAAMHEFRMFVYGGPYRAFSYLTALNASAWVTADARDACVFLVIEPEEYILLPLRPHPRTLPYWNDGLNHVIVSLSDKWAETAPPAESLGKAAVMASCLQETEYRPGFDISIPLPGLMHLDHLQSVKPWQRRYFLTFKGTRYLGPKEGNFRSGRAFLDLHNGEDVIVAVTCSHKTNDKVRLWHPEEGKGCEEDELTYKQYDFGELMNTTFGLAPAGRSPASYRLIEILSAGAIPVLIADNYVKPFEPMIQWHRCLLQFPTSEVHRILPALRAMRRAEMNRRQRYCLFVYRSYLKDNDTLVRSVVQALQLRFYGVLPNFNLTSTSKEETPSALNGPGCP